MSSLMKKNSIQTSNSTTSIQNKSLNDKQKQIQDLKKQINQWKQKAHQAFLQVIHIQSLHEEEINQIKEQNNLKINQFTKSYENLQLKYQKSQQNVQNFMKNYNQNMYQFQKSLCIDIDVINFRQEVKSQVSEMSFLKDLQAQCNYDQKILSIKDQITETMTNYLEKQGQKVLGKMIEKLKNDFVNLHQHNERLLKLNQQLQQKAKNSKNLFESLKKQSEFMTQHIKSLSTQKSKFSKRINELQTQKKIINDEMQRYKRFNMKSIQATKNMKKNIQCISPAIKIQSKQQSDEQKDDSINITQLINGLNQVQNFNKKNNVKSLKSNLIKPEIKLIKQESSPAPLKKPLSKQRQTYSKFRNKNN